MKIDVNSNYCKVEGTRDELQELRTLLTCDVPGAKFTPQFRRKKWDGKKRFFNYVAKKFPIGFLAYVKEHIPTADIHDHRVFPKISPDVPELNGIEWRDYQLESLDNCLRAKNCLVHAATNAGKTAIFAGLVMVIHPNPTIILVHRQELMAQCIAELEEKTGLDVGFISAKGDVLRPVVVAMVQTLINRIGVDEEVTEFFNNTQCIIVDETHHAQAKSYQEILAACRAPYRFGFSGTIEEQDQHTGMLVRANLGSVEFTITNNELIDLGVSAKPQIFLFETDAGEVTKDCMEMAYQEADQTYGGDYTKKDVLRYFYNFSYDLGIVHHTNRNECCLEIIERNKKKSILIVVDRIAHGRNVRDMIRYVEPCMFISGDEGEKNVRERALKEFKDGELRVLVSSNIIDEGIDISRIGVLVMLAGKKSKRQVLQRVGRSLRKKHGVNTVKIYDFVDYGNRHLEKHSKQRIKIYKDEGFEISFM